MGRHVFPGTHTHVLDGYDGGVAHNDGLMVGGVPALGAGSYWVSLIVLSGFDEYNARDL